MTVIGITMGCPVGIGPEIILKAFQNRTFHQDITPLIIGDLGVLQRCRDLLKVNVECIAWSKGEPFQPGKIQVQPVSQLPEEGLTWGKPNKDTGSAMANYITNAVSLVQEGIIQGIVTCPISKFALLQAGIDFPGHTEMLASWTGSQSFTMMMAGKTLRITLVTIHCPLSSVMSQLSVEKILKLIQITHSALKIDFALPNPRIAVAGFNPHAGEQEMFGDEETNYIVPAIKAAQDQGIHAEGPFPPDTVFYKTAKGDYDVVVCMYHDQGLIPFKLLHFSDGVNVTLGLPIVRTSVDHGTAYNIAGKGLADPASLIAAIELAWTISKNRNKLQS
jgi:4-hydroxythreonine-4-phosphate dehydrogenase